MSPGFLLCAIHAALWASFGVAWLTRRHRGSSSKEASPELVVTSQEYTAPYSRSILAFHLFGFAAMYVGILKAVLPERVPTGLLGQHAAGALVIAAGAVLIAWGAASLRSWRFRARLDHGHELATGGAFRLLRHPIYAGINLVALGTAIWTPTFVTWTASLLIVVGSDLRARAEESVLKQAFGSRYADYARCVKRFIPGVY